MDEKDIDADIAGGYFEMDKPWTKLRVRSGGFGCATGVYDQDGKPVDLKIKSIKWECDARGPAVLTLECYGVPADVIGFIKPDDGEGGV